jgi:hypothetical protein
MDNDLDWNVQEEAAEDNESGDDEESINCAASRNDLK